MFPPSSLLFEWYGIPEIKRIIVHKKNTSARFSKKNTHILFVTSFLLLFLQLLFSKLFSSSFGVYIDIIIIFYLVDLVHVVASKKMKKMKITDFESADFETYSERDIL